MKKILLCFFAAILLCTQLVSAQVVTTNTTEGYADFVYVAGETDNYPIEYYDSEKEAYCGIIPDLLEKISEKSGVDFVYINGDKASKLNLAKNLQVDIVSSVSKEEKLQNVTEYLELVSYDKNGSTTKYGIGFTKVADSRKISAVKEGFSKLTDDEKTGIYLSYTSEKAKNNYIWLILAGVIVLLLIALVVFMIFHIKKVRKISEEEKFLDEETGIGNLRFFKYHFRYTIGDISRTLYHVAYIILDSSYLRSYHGDSSFDDVLKYTAAVLSENTADREISARITENGFVFAFQSTNEDDAKKRLKEIMHKLNNFEDMKEKSNKLVFHCAVYHLQMSDKNSEILLFNLRKNCNKIFGTDKQIVFCDTRSMNMVQEEKKITESILKGFENNEFKIYLQFIVDNKTKKVVSAEALSRWDSHEKGLISPSKYIGNMETAGLIGKHDFHMFELVCRQLEKWKDTEYKNISISCNFTRITLSEENFIDKLKMIADGYDFNKSNLSIEITEDAIEKDRDAATENVRRSKELGLTVYLDDLGSGYTSLSNLCDYPIDVVKIDRDILLKTDTERGKDLFSGIIALAHSLDIKVICEGVETEPQSEFVTKSQCDFVQGWYYSKPFPVSECEEFLIRYKNKQAKK